MCVSSITGISSRLLPPPALHLGVATLGTVQVTIDERSEAIRAKFMAGAVEAMSL